MLDIDLRGVLVAARAGVPALLRRPVPRQGRFLAVASAAATRGLPMLAAYCAAKAGVLGMIRALAAELRDTGVTANAAGERDVEGLRTLLDEGNGHRERSRGLGTRRPDRRWAGAARRPRSTSTPPTDG